VSVCLSFPMHSLPPDVKRLVVCHACNIPSSMLSHASFIGAFSASSMGFGYFATRDDIRTMSSLALLSSQLFLPMLDEFGSLATWVLFARLLEGFVPAHLRRQVCLRGTFLQALSVEHDPAFTEGMPCCTQLR
jgi:hypothetical protein